METWIWHEDTYVISYHRIWMDSVTHGLSFKLESSDKIAQIVKIVIGTLKNTKSNYYFQNFIREETFISL